MTRKDGCDEDAGVSLLAEDQYFRQVRCTPDLTLEEERDLLERIDRGKAEQCQASPDVAVLETARVARDRLVEGYQRLVVYIARKYASRFRSMELLDLIQEGNIGLLEAIAYNDNSKGYRFSTIAGRCIRQAIWAAMRDRDRHIRVSKWVDGTLLKARKVKQQLAQALGREPELVEVAEVMGVPVERLQDYLDLDERAEVRSVQLLLREAESGEGEDYLHFTHLYASWVKAEQHQATEREQALRCAIKGALTEPQRKVIYLRYGLVEGEECPRSVMETAQTLGVWPQAVGRAESRARQRLYEALAPVIGGQDELMAS